MPHNIIEYSDTLESVIDLNELVQNVFSATRETGLFKEASIKTRAIPYKHYQVGSEQLQFIHITVKLLSGRTIEQKQALSNTVFDCLKKLGLNKVSLSVDIVDMEKETYSN